MKRLGLLALLAALAAPAALCAAPAGNDPVVAVRGNDELTASQVRALLADTPAETRASYEKSPENLKSLIRDMLLGRAILAEAQSQHWDSRPEIAALAQRAHDLAITQSFLAAQAKLPPNYPSDAELQAAWEANKAQLMQPRGYKLAQIFLAASGAEQDTARKKLTELHSQLNHGHAGFDQATATRLAGAKYAELGWTAENRMAPEVKDAVAGLPEGSVSTPLCVPAACMLLKLEATRPAGPAPLAEVREQLVRALRQQKSRALQQDYANALLAKTPLRVDEIQLSHLAGQ